MTNVLGNILLFIIMNKKKDKWDICRTCGNTGDIEIFGRDGVALQLEEKINTYLPITVILK